METAPASQPLRQLGWAAVGLLVLLGLVSMGGAAVVTWPAALLLALVLRRGSTSQTVVVGLTAGAVVALALLVLMLV